MMIKKGKKKNMEGVGDGKEKREEKKEKTDTASLY